MLTSQAELPLPKFRPESCSLRGRWLRHNEIIFRELQLDTVITQSSYSFFTVSTLYTNNNPKMAKLGTTY